MLSTLYIVFCKLFWVLHYALVMFTDLTVSGCRIFLANDAEIQLC